MGFLLRTAFWFSLVMLVLPFDTTGEAGAPAAVGPVDAFLAAREAVGDIAEMCERKPDVCEVGRSALHTIGARARESARLAYTMMEGDAAPAADDAIRTGSIEVAAQD